MISLYFHFASCSALWYALAPRRDRRFPLLFRDNSVCCSPLCLSKKVLPKISYISHSPECVLLWSCSSQYKENNDDQDEILKWRNPEKCSTRARQVATKRLNAWALMNVQEFSHQCCILCLWLYTSRMPVTWGVLHQSPPPHTHCSAFFVFLSLYILIIKRIILTAVIGCPDIFKNWFLPLFCVQPCKSPSCKAGTGPA